MEGKVYVYLNDKSKYFRLKINVIILQFQPNIPPTKKELDLLYKEPLKKHFSEFGTIKFDYELLSDSVHIYIENDEDYELLKSKYEWK
mgnify:CR=1 FL=1